MRKGANGLNGTRILVVSGGVFSILLIALITVAFVAPLRFAALRIVLPLREKLTVHALRGGAYWVSGGISNTGFIIGDDGVIAIDSQMFIKTARKQLTEIAKLTPKPVNVMILTHDDPDHINGLPAYPHCMQIIAHENAVRRMRQFINDPYLNGFPADPRMKDYLPSSTVQGTVTRVLNGVTVRLIHAGPAHTDNDIVVYLPVQRIVYAGDLLTPAASLYPGVHLNKNGSSLGFFAFMRTILALDADLYVSGHGDLLSRAELVKRLAAAEDRRAQIKQLFDQGHTLKEAKATLHDESLTGNAARFPTFVETTYLELNAERSSNHGKPAAR